MPRFLISRQPRRAAGLWTAWIIWILILAPWSSWALRFDVFVGNGEILPEAGWFPVVCEVRNDGPSFNGIIEITGKGFGGGPVRRVALELPGGTTKRATLPVFCSAQDYSWTCRLLDERRRVRAEVELDSRQQGRKSAARSTTILAALSRTVSGQPSFPLIKSRQTEFQPIVGRLQIALFPENPLVLERANLIYLSSQMAIELSVNQVNGLLTWLHEGGHLVVGMEQPSDLSGAPWLRELLPGNFSETRSVKMDRELQDWIVRASPSERPAAGGKRTRTPTTVASQERNAYTDVAEDAAFEGSELRVVTGTVRNGKVLVQAGEAPLVIQTERGRGRVTLLAFSPEREPFLSWKNRSWFWARLANLPADLFESSDFSRFPGESMDSVFGAMIESRQIQKLPLGWLLLLLLAYLAVIGPIDQFWLKKINRPMLTWITFPAYVCAFSLLIYFIGFRLRAGDSEYNELQVVDVFPHGAQTWLRGRSYASIYSPANANYPLQSEQAYASLRGEFSPTYGRHGETIPAQITQVGNHFEAQVFVPIWTSELYVGDWLQPAAAPLTGKLETKAAGRQLRVQNHMGEPVTDLHCVVDGTVYALGTVSPGATITFELGGANSTNALSLRDFVQRHGAEFRNLIYRRRTTFAAGQSLPELDLAKAAMAASFVSELNEIQKSPGELVTQEGFDLTRWTEGNHAVLLAFAPNRLLAPAMNRFTPRRNGQNSLLRLVLEKGEP